MLQLVFKTDTCGKTVLAHLGFRFRGTLCRYISFYLRLNAIQEEYELFHTLDGLITLMWTKLLMFNELWCRGIVWRLTVVRHYNSPSTCLVITVWLKAQVFAQPTLWWPAVNVSDCLWHKEDVKWSVLQKVYQKFHSVAFVSMYRLVFFWEMVVIMWNYSCVASSEMQIL